jgi:N-acetylneuraminic acid mutarotase
VVRRAILWGSSVALLLAGCTGEGAAPAASPLAEDAEWEQLAPIPTPRTEVTAAALGDSIYVIGGFDAAGRTVPTVEVYDIEADTWNRGPDLPVAVNHAMSAVAGGTLYVIGGYLGPLSDPTTRTFALSQAGWEELPQMPEPRAAAGATAVGTEIFVAGGVGPTGLADFTPVFDIDTRRWRTETGLLTPREHLGVEAFGGQVYAVGGRTGGIGTNLGEAEAFDPATGNWRPLPPMPTPRGGLAAAATSSGLIVAPGGEADATFSEAEAFDVEEGRWVVLPPMPTARHGLGVAAVGDTVHVIAGGPTPGLSVSGANEALDLSRAPETGKG